MRCSTDPIMSRTGGALRPLTFVRTANSCRSHPGFMDRPCTCRGFLQSRHCSRYRRSGNAPASGRDTLAKAGYCCVKRRSSDRRSALATGIGNCRLPVRSNLTRTCARDWTASLLRHALPAVLPLTDHQHYERAGTAPILWSSETQAGGRPDQRHSAPRSGWRAGNINSSDWRPSEARRTGCAGQTQAAPVASARPSTLRAIGCGRVGGGGGSETGASWRPQRWRVDEEELCVNEV